MNGQRRLTAPEVTVGQRKRNKGTEVFLGRLPRDCYEDELMPVLEQVGRLLELRLMLDFSGSTRGYAFASYETSRIAREACARLNGYEIRPGHHIGVVKSMDNCRLFFGGVPKNKTKPEFMAELTKMLEDITDIYLYPSAHDRSLNRGFIFVEFKDHRAAAMARRKLIPGKVMLWDHEIAVDWADPEPGEPIDEDIMERVSFEFPLRKEDVFTISTGRGSALFPLVAKSWSNPRESSVLSRNRYRQWRWSTLVSCSALISLPARYIQPCCSSPAR